MADRVYKIVEVAGSSTESSDKAIGNAIEAISKTVKNLDWYEVVEQRGYIEDNKVAHYQVVLKVGFRVEA